MKIAQDSAVAFEYTLTTDAGQVIDSSKGRDPLHYLHGHGNLIPGMEKALEGRQAGDAFQIRISPEEGYGVHRPEMVHVLPKSQFEGVPNLAEGMQLQAHNEQGHHHVVKVVKIEGDTVTIDANHELAGVALNFDLKVVSVRKASAEEVSHGHIHGAGGHHH